MPGGGPFAELVRRAQAHQGYGDATAHAMALLAMAQYGLMMAGIEGQLVAAAGLSQIREVLAAGYVDIRKVLLRHPGSETCKRVFILRGIDLATALQGRRADILGLGIVLIVVSHSLESLLGQFPGSTLISDLARDLGIGFLVAVFVTALLEHSVARETQSQIRQAYEEIIAKVETKVLESAYKQLVPPPIFTQIRENVFQSKVFRTGWTITIRVLSPLEDPELYKQVRNKYSSDIYIAEVAYAYSLLNTRSQPEDYVFKGGIDLDTPLSHLNIPYISWVRIKSDNPSNNLEATLTEKDTASVWAGQPATPAAGLTVMKDEVSGQVVFRTGNLQMRANEEIEIRFRAMRAIRAPGLFVIAASVPADGAQILVLGGPLRLKVIALHPNRGALVEVEPNRRWAFKCGILPWQGFQVTAEPVDKQRTPSVAG